MYAEAVGVPLRRRRTLKTGGATEQAREFSKSRCRDAGASTKIQRRSHLC